MKTIQIRNITIGEGRPKICVPVVGQTEEDILREAAGLASLPADVVEWRADWFQDVFDTEKVLHTAKALRSVLGELPLLFTFRTAKEGGEKEISAEAYRKLNLALAASGFVDLIDVELFSGNELVKELIREAHSHGVKVIVSNHDFHKTPSKEELIHRLRLMQDFDADLPKIAVMPPGCSHAPECYSGNGRNLCRPSHHHYVHVRNRRDQPPYRRIFWICSDLRSRQKSLCSRSDPCI